MHDIEKKARQAQRLLADETYQQFAAEFRERQSRVFLNACSTPEQREAAHENIRGLHRFEVSLREALDNHTIEQKKGQERAID